MTTENKPAVLSASELNQLRTFEKTIENTVECCESAGRALQAIRDKKLYRAEYATFEAYCATRWGKSRMRVHQLITAFELKESLPADCKPWFTNERQARELARVAPSERANVLREAAKDGKVTAAKIRKIAGEKTIELDKLGYQIPETILDNWRRAQEFGERLRQVSALRKLLEDAKAEGDVVFSEISTSTISEVRSIYGSLKCVIPYAVCPTCQGVKPSKCTLCKGRGFMSEFAYTQLVPAEVKELREKGKK